MIKAAKMTEDGPVILLGLSRLNHERLVAGMDIDADLRSIGIKAKVVITYGEDEDAIMQRFSAGQVVDKRPPGGGSN